MTRSTLRSMTRAPKAYRKRPWCAPTCASTLLKHHGIDAPIKTLATEAKTSKGTPIPNIALLFLRRGLDVHVDYWDPSFKGSLQHLEGDELFTACQSSFKRFRWIRAMAEFRDLGGTFRARPAKMADVVRAVAADEPPIVVVDTAQLDRLDKVIASHAIIPIEFDRKRVIVLDPNSAERWAQWVYPREEFETSFRWMGSCAIFVTKK